MVAFLVFRIYATWAHFAFLMNFFVLHFCFHFLLEFLMFYLLPSILIPHLFQWFPFCDLMVAFLVFGIYANWAHFVFLMNFFVLHFCFYFLLEFLMFYLLLSILIPHLFRWFPVCDLMVAFLVFVFMQIEHILHFWWIFSFCIFVFNCIWSF